MKTSFGEKIRSFFGFGKKIDDSFLENLEDILIEGDFGAKNAFRISNTVQEKKPSTNEEFQQLLKNEIEQSIFSTQLIPDKNELNLFLVLGVNGVGKTTTIAKLAKYYKEKDYKVVLAAGDTFRAAAIDQLTYHAEKLNTRIVKQENGSDAGAVIYDAISSAISRSDNLILCDTAGRMHNKEDLLRELQKIDKIVKARIKPENYKKILVLDATTGQNIISQAELFNNAVKIDALIITKYDSLSKGGAVTQIGIPVAFIGTGEKYEDLQEFDKNEFLTSLLGV